MSIYDRDYMRSRKPESQLKQKFSEYPAVCWLICVNIAIFFLSIFLGFIYPLFSLSADSVCNGMVWTFFTYAFLHGDMLHILFNLLGLYFMGIPLERWLGWRKFLAIYFAGVFLGGLVWLGISWGSGAVLVGASAGVMAVLAAFCLLFPPTPITFLIFFIIPVSVKPITMLKIVSAIEFIGFLSSMVSGGSDIAYSAHLGGLGAGLTMVEIIKRGGLSFLDNIGRYKFVKFTDKKKPSSTDFKFKVNISESDTDEIDRILAKVNKDGFTSLTDEEREFLRRVNK